MPFRPLASGRMPPDAQRKHGALQKSLLHSTLMAMPSNGHAAGLKTHSPILFPDPDSARTVIDEGLVSECMSFAVGRQLMVDSSSTVHPHQRIPGLLPRAPSQDSAESGRMAQQSGQYRGRPWGDERQRVRLER